MFFAKMFSEFWHSRGSRRLIVRDTIVVFSTAVLLIGFTALIQIDLIPWSLLPAFTPLLFCGCLIEIIHLAIMSVHWTIQAELWENTFCLGRSDIILAFGRYHLQSEDDWKCWRPWQVAIWLQRKKNQDPRWKIVKLRAHK